MNISPRILFAFVAAMFGACAGAAVLPPEKLLPRDALLVVTVPDWAKAKTFWNSQPLSRLARDPALTPFVEKFLDKFTNGVIKPVEQGLGIKFSDYAGLAQGQVTFAVVPVTVKTKSDVPAAAVLLIDAKDHSQQLKSNLALVLKKWADAGKPSKSQKIRETDFTTIFISPDDLSLKKIFPGDNLADDVPAAPPGGGGMKKAELTVGQSDSLLMVSTSTEALEKIMSRQSGGMIPPLEESASFQADYAQRLRQSPFYFWLNLKGLADLIAKAPPGADGQPSAISAGVNTFLDATGVSSLRSLSLSYKQYPDGDSTQFFLSVPEDKRPPILKIFAPEAKDAGPPAFVPADAIKYWRWRLDMAGSWKKLEAMLNELLPAQAMAQVNMLFALAGKDKDEHYDLKSELLNNLGDDIISYSKPPAGDSLEDLKSPPTLYLLASPNPDKLAAAFKVLLVIPFQGAAVVDREFLGRKIYSISSPAAPGAKPSGLNFCASGSYLAIAGDAGILEEYLRNSGKEGKSLRDTPGLADAAQRVGGLETGFFGYENESQTMRPLFDVLRKQNPSVPDILGVPIPNVNLLEELENIRGWADFSLLPPFDAIAKYFSFSVFSASATPDGFALNVFMPTPPKLRQ
ncbi:MAG TPA: hypothetical protein VGO59_19780 [Verrucomicrobiae bacterium]|jgi:hypothetical protein